MSRLFLGILVFCCILSSGCNVLKWHQNGILKDLRSVGVKPQLSGTKYGLHSYLEGGKGKTIVFIHGFGAGAPETWGKQLSFFAKKGYKVYAPDLFWFGNNKTNKPHLFQTPKEQADAIATWMDSRGIKKATIAGVSFGGYISLMMAIHHPQKVDKLILVDSAGLEPTKLEQNQILKSFSFASELQYVLIPKNKEHLKIFLDKVFYKPRWIPGFALQQILEGDFWKNRDQKRRIARFLEKNFLKPELVKNIKAKTLLIWGKYDRIIPLSIGKRMSSFIQGSKLVVVQKSGHIPMLEQPQKVNKAIADFLK